MKPYYQDEAVTIYHGDCRDILPHLEPVDLVLTDPPYGINRDHSGHKVIARLGAIVGDDKPFNPRPILGVGQTHILWGANHYASRLPDESCWLLWLKHDHSFFTFRSTSPFELAWTDIGGASRAYRHIWDGSIKQGEGFGHPHVHPAEKPLELMRWCLSLVPDAHLILDPFMGSGTTLRAAKDLGRKSIGIEIEERYCEIAAKRMAQTVMALEG